MNQDANPYRSPGLALEPVAEPACDDSLQVRRGKRMYLGIAASLLVLEFGPSFLLGSGPSLIQVVVRLALLVSGWQGYGWGIALLAISLALGILVSIATLAQAIAAGSGLGIALSVLSGFVAGAFLWAFVYSRSLNAFFKHQEQHRSSRVSGDQATSDKRNLVTLTPAAAAFARRSIADRQYPPETALRVVLREGCDPGVDVQYDLASDDGRDWVGESSGIVILVSKDISEQLNGLTIDTENGAYVFRLGEEAKGS